MFKVVFVFVIIKTSLVPKHCKELIRVLIMVWWWRYWTWWRRWRWCQFSRIRKKNVEVIMVAKKQTDTRLSKDLAQDSQ